MSKVYIVRHGETYWNELNIMHGQMDVPLNEKGKAQAIDIALNLMDTKFDVCYCSPLQRAVCTASQILKFHKNTPMFMDNRLMEIYKGDLEGTHNDSEKLLKNEDVEFLMAHNIESKAHFFKRVKDFYDEILIKNKDKDILIVAHSGTVKMSSFYFEPPAKNIVEAYYDIHIKNCSVTTFENKLPTKQPKLVEYSVDKERYVWI